MQPLAQTFFIANLARCVAYIYKSINLGKQIILENTKRKEKYVTRNCLLAVAQQFFFNLHVYSCYNV